ncbi:acyl-CoA reductase [Flavobacterium sp. NKUCC04_CG]|uniref:acyl-CoA reductase n=1 Tax=Flavobacterium sp. NKUCC04_CG TaxID=2842121 RepID=UPI001C5AA0A6|nr:acyl-CoA reductase [Flavobacterium sp. NKUCC04_CG]MBW3519346.1 acyl-CoA reductase [Flavobacterium sp. NKUCC04_CG]
MILEDKKLALVALGQFLKQFSQATFSKDQQVLGNEVFYSRFEEAVVSAVHYNGWFTVDQVVLSIQSWSAALTLEELNQWTQAYDFDREPLKNVGLILAGNIPLVGFHDFLSVLISGNIVSVKMSSNDQRLLPILADYLIFVEPRFKERIRIVEGRLEKFDAVIATGSNNTSRYFEYYFDKVPNIIRKNRNSLAVLDGNETKSDLIALGSDIFTFFGLGCRNVSKLLVPKGYNFDAFFEAMFEFQDVIHYEKYSNNYDYNKAVFLMSNFKILDNGFLTIKEDESFASPISSVFYEYYEDVTDLKKELKLQEEKIQCIVSNNLVDNSIAFGQTQFPKLWDYADGVDSLSFLLKL